MVRLFGKREDKYGGYDMPGLQGSGIGVSKHMSALWACNEIV